MFVNLHLILFFFNIYTFYHVQSIENSVFSPDNVFCNNHVINFVLLLNLLRNCLAV